MNICILSEFFLPQQGGVQIVSHLLAREFVKLGHTVSVLTSTRKGFSHRDGYSVLRASGALGTIGALCASDVVISQGGFCLKLGWPLLLFRRPTLIVRHSIRRNVKEKGFVARSKRYLEKRCKVAFVSRYMASLEPTEPQALLPNPYDDALFYDDHEIQRPNDLIFVSRHISHAKGFYVLLDALAILRDKGLKPSVTVVGEEGRAIAETVLRKKRLWDQVLFLGAMSNERVASVLRKGRLLVVPSTIEEAFGIIVLEGLASGCEVVASNLGGLPEALGGFGMLFEAGDPLALAEAIQAVLGDSRIQRGAAIGKDKHLSEHKPCIVAQAYLAQLESLLEEQL